jgi:hypothetical protein
VVDDENVRQVISEFRGKKNDKNVSNGQMYSLSICRKKQFRRYPQETHPIQIEFFFSTLLHLLSLSLCVFFGLSYIFIGIEKCRIQSKKKKAFDKTFWCVFFSHCFKQKQDAL